MISYLEENKKFNFRVAGIISNEDNTKVLLHRKSKINFWLLPGGRVEMLESTEDAVIREMKEELDIDCKIKKLAVTSETFFKLGDIRYHEIAYYYFLNAAENKLLKKEEFYGVEGEDYIFKWFDISELKNLDLRPKLIQDYLNNPNQEFKHIIKNEMN